MTDQTQEANSGQIERTDYISRAQLVGACLPEDANNSEIRKIGSLWVIFTKRPEQLALYGTLSFTIGCAPCLHGVYRCICKTKRYTALPDPYNANPTRKERLWLVSKQSVTDMLPELERLVSVYQSGVPQEHRLKNLYVDALATLRKWVESNFEEK